ncbi:MAG: hypothetical protein WCZ87_10555, partial [Thiohalobacteraceae bacterium]
PMWLMHLYVRTATANDPRGVSVWVDAADAISARQQALAALAAQGWTLDRVDDAAPTGADDYFRACPSQRAFRTAQDVGIAWRFDDE